MNTIHSTKEKLYGLFNLHVQLDFTIGVCLLDTYHELSEDDLPMIGMIDVHRREDAYECGYCFHSTFHGKGYAKEGLQAILDWISNGIPTRFLAGTALNNLPSVRLLESLDFRKIGEEKISFYQDEQGNDIIFTGGIFERIMQP